MAARMFSLVSVVALCTSVVALCAVATLADTPKSTSTGTAAWRPPGSASRSSQPKPAAAQPAVLERAESVARGVAKGAAASVARSVLRTAGNTAPTSAARVSRGTGTLPNEHGQVWREYDISAYTLRVTSTNQPQQAIIDWILRETGHESWHTEPVALLSCTKRTLRVYHTPEVQRVVAEIVDRFVSTQAETHTLSVRVVTIGHPNWRSR